MLIVYLLTAMLLAGCGNHEAEEGDADVDDQESDSDDHEPDADTTDPDADITDLDADATDPDAEVPVDGVIDDGLHPVLSSFRVEEAQPDRLYFDSSEPINASETTGFIVTGGKTITGIHVEAGATTGHYFTMDGGFTFFDNTTLRYEGGSDLQDLMGNALYAFTLRYVENFIPEPPAPAFRYVTASASGGGDGTSEAAAWTMAEAGANAQAGQTVWIKAGDYGNAPMVVGNNGTEAAPIRFIGYQTAPDDAPHLTRSQDTEFDPGAMPYIHTSSTSGNGIDLAGRRFIIVKNIQIAGYSNALNATGAVHDCLAENIYAKDPAIGLNFFHRDTRRVRIKGCYVINASDDGIWIAGDSNLIDDAYLCSLGAPNMDYYIALYGGTIGTGNIIRNSAIVRDPADTHTGHGFSVKAGGYPLEHTLVEDCTVHEVAQAIELRHSQTRYTVARNVVATGPEEGNLVTFRDDTSYNIVENCVADGVYAGVKFTDNLEEDTVGTPQAGGHHNKVINTVFMNCGRSVTVGTIMYSGQTPVESTENELLNCTFYGSSAMFSLSFDLGDSNRLVNCNIVDVATEAWGDGTPTQSYTNCNSWESWGDLPGTDNVSLDPQLVDAPNGNFRLQDASPIKDLGTDLDAVHYDMDDVERPSGEYSIGAYE